MTQPPKQRRTNSPIKLAIKKIRPATQQEIDNIKRAGRGVDETFPTKVFNGDWWLIETATPEDMKRIAQSYGTTARKFPGKRGITRRAENGLYVRTVDIEGDTTTTNGHREAGTDEGESE